MKQQRMMKRLLTRAGMLVTAAGFLTLPLAGTVLAGKEGVFLSDSVYFTLDKVTLSAGADDSSLRFSLDLNNNSADPVDFNQYGVKVMDSQGVSYTAKLTEKTVARVKPNETGSFKFSSKIPTNLDPGQLKIDIFKWDYNRMQDIGALSVEKAIGDGQAVLQQAVLNMQELDSTLPDDALVTAALGNSYKVYKDGVWNVYTDLTLENLGSTTLKLPDGLEYNLQDNKGLTYGAQFADGSGVSLLPEQPVKVTMQAAVPATLDMSRLTLLFSPKGQVKTTVLGSLSLTSSFVSGKIGDSANYPKTDAEGLAIATSWAAASKQSDGLHLQANVTLTNRSDEIVTLPDLSASFQALRGGVAVTSSDNAVRTAYLSPNESTTFRFSGVLPAGLNTDALQLVVLEKPASGTAQQGTGQTGSDSQSGTTASSSKAALPVMVTALAGAGSGGEVSSYTAAQAYTIGEPFSLSASDRIDSNLDLSLVELGMSENSDFGYRTVVAKYKLTNKGTSTVTLPDFQTDLTSPGGYTYSGARQSSVAKDIAPNTSYVLSYSYMLPDTEKGDQLALNLYDANRLAMGSYKTAVQPIPAQGEMSLYPFMITLNDASFSATYNRDQSYAYRMRMDLDVKRQEQVITDANFSQLLFEVVDAKGRLLSSKVFAFTGQDKIMSGIQFVDFGNIKSEQLNDDVSINMYEVVATPNGDAKRLLRTIEP